MVLGGGCVMGDGFSDQYRGVSRRWIRVKELLEKILEQKILESIEKGDQ